MKRQSTCFYFCSIMSGREPESLVQFITEGMWKVEQNLGKWLIDGKSLVWPMKTLGKML
jgi:hypothetical protein